MIKQDNGGVETVLIDYSILEPIGNFVPPTAGKAIAWNPAGEATKTAIYGR